MNQPTAHFPPSRPRPRRSPTAPGGAPSIPTPETTALAAAVPPEPVQVAVNPVRALGEALRPLGLLLSASSQGELPWNVTAAFGTPYGGHRFALGCLEDGQALVHELPGHLAAPSVWEAGLAYLKRSGGLSEGPDRDATSLMAWTAGYAAARRYFFTSKGLFIPLHAARRQDVPCPYTGASEQQGFLIGVGAYLSAVRLNVQDHQLTPFISLHAAPQAPPTQRGTPT